jgi:hypothetical protein
MAIATGVVGDPAVAAILAALDVAAERGRAAALDGRHHLELAEAQMPGIALPSCSQGGAPAQIVKSCGFSLFTKF